jgi:hypothetical protein
MEVKEVSACMGVSGRHGVCLRAWEFLFKSGAVIGSGSVSQVRPEDKMVTLLFYHSPIFSLIMMRVGAEDQILR